MLRAALNTPMVVDRLVSGMVKPSRRSPKVGWTGFRYCCELDLLGFLRRCRFRGERDPHVRCTRCHNPSQRCASASAAIARCADRKSTLLVLAGEVEVYGMHGARSRALLAEQYQLAPREAATCHPSHYHRPLRRERGQASSAVNEALSWGPGIVPE